jgi:hypothetical protein
MVNAFALYSAQEFYIYKNFSGNMGAPGLGFPLQFLANRLAVCWLKAVKAGQKNREAIWACCCTRMALRAQGLFRFWDKLAG